MACKGPCSPMKVHVKKHLMVKINGALHCGVSHSHIVVLRHKRSDTINFPDSYVHRESLPHVRFQDVRLELVSDLIIIIKHCCLIIERHSGNISYSIPVTLGTALFLLQSFEKYLHVDHQLIVPNTRYNLTRQRRVAPLLLTGSTIYVKNIVVGNLYCAYPFATTFVAPASAQVQSLRIEFAGHQDVNIADYTTCCEYEVAKIP